MLAETILQEEPTAGETADPVEAMSEAPETAPADAGETTDGEENTADGSAD